MKYLFITEKPSVAQEFARALKVTGTRNDGYIESDKYIVTWCVGHLITMSYPEAYDPAMKKWQMDTLPFIPEDWKYEVIPGVKKQYTIVAGLLNRQDVERIYICTDSGREGEYIYRLVDQMAQVPETKDKRRVWIDSQTEEEIMRGIREAKPMSEYDNVSDAAYLRAKEDYLMGINFSRALTLKYGYTIRDFLHRDRNVVIAVGRVMTCVLGMIVKREREIREFKKTPFYRIIARVSLDEEETDAEWRAVKGSRYFESPLLYGDKANGFKKKSDAEHFVDELESKTPLKAQVSLCTRKKELKNPPLLFNLAELQNECSRLFKISPDETLNVVQELYEKKLVTYPRTDARVLSTAVAKEIYKNLSGLSHYEPVGAYASAIVEHRAYEKIYKSRYVNDKAITDHYAIIPTGQGLSNLPRESSLARSVYEVIARRFVSIFLKPAEYQKVAVTFRLEGESFFTSMKILSQKGYLAVLSQKEDEKDKAEKDLKLMKAVSDLKKEDTVTFAGIDIKEGETKPPKRYNSGSLILAMENAGQLIEDEDLREQIKGSGIGTSATRAEIIKKLVTRGYISLNKKTQIITPTLLGELICDVVAVSIYSLLNPELTASWEKGLGMVAEGELPADEYLKKMGKFVTDKTEGVKSTDNRSLLQPYFRKAQACYPVTSAGGAKKKKTASSRKKPAKRSGRKPESEAAVR